MNICACRFTSLRSLLVCQWLILLIAVSAYSDEPSASIGNGTPIIDGLVDEVWLAMPKIPVKRPGLGVMSNQAVAQGTARLMWDDRHLYLLFEVRDETLSDKHSIPWQQDSIEFFVDENHARSNKYEADDVHYRVSFRGRLSGDGAFEKDNIKVVATETEGGYRIEAAAKWLTIDGEPGRKIGFELQVNDDPGVGERRSVVKWASSADNSWCNTSRFGTVTLDTKAGGLSPSNEQYDPVPTNAAETIDPTANKWEGAIKEFERQDDIDLPDTQSILFVGSSSIVRWDLDSSFPNLKTINRGFGGSQVSDSLQFVDRIILKYKPRTVVLYAGDNDIAGGKSAIQVTTDFKSLVAKIHAELPKTNILFIAIKPSLSRWGLIGKMREANRQVQEFADQCDHVEYVDVDRPMLTDDGTPQSDLFVDDGLHLSETGYELWTSLVKPRLSKSR